MGGLAFASGPDPLFTPRMPQTVYTTMKARCHEILGAIYRHVNTPIEGPAKTDFGDIDILVCGPMEDGPPRAPHAALLAIQKALGATRVLIDKTAGKSASAHMALPWPAEMVDSTPLQSSEADAAPPAAAFIQVDIRICETWEQQRWISFKHSHGDVWSILGAMIRPYGLTADEEALYLRIPDIENANRKRARIFLTSDPSAVLDFLGLPHEPFDLDHPKPFESLDTMYEYVALCRVFWVHPAADTDDDEGGETSSKPQGASRVDGTQGIEADFKKLKSNDRRRLSQRPAFRAWLEGYLPRCREDGRFAVEPMTRDAVRDAAFEHFPVREEFYRQRADFLQEKEKDTVLRLIKESVPDVEDGISAADRVKQQNNRGHIIKAFRQLIVEDDKELQDKWGLSTGPFKDENGRWLLPNVANFLTENIDVVGRKALAEHKRQF